MKVSPNSGATAWNAPEARRFIDSITATLAGELSAHAKRTKRAIRRAEPAAAKCIRYGLLDLTCPWCEDRLENDTKQPSRQEWYPRPSASPALAIAMLDRLWTHGDSGAIMQAVPDALHEDRPRHLDQTLTIHRETAIYRHERFVNDHGRNMDIAIDTKYLPEGVVPMRGHYIHNGFRDLARSWHDVESKARRTTRKEVLNAAHDAARRNRYDGNRDSGPAPTGHPVADRIALYLMRLERAMVTDAAENAIGDDD